MDIILIMPLKSTLFDFIFSLFCFQLGVTQTHKAYKVEANDFFFQESILIEKILKKVKPIHIPTNSTLHITDFLHH